MFFRTRSREPASATPKPLDMVKERAVPAKTLFILGQEDHDLPEGERDVLGVDDDSGCQVLAEMLQDSGYVVDTAVTLAEAKQLLAQFRYGVVLADWRPPDGDGSVLANLATAVGSYVFVMSGYPARMLPGSLDARQTLMKPVMRSASLAAVHACIAPRVPKEQRIGRQSRLVHPWRLEQPRAVGRRHAHRHLVLVALHLQHDLAAGLATRPNPAPERGEARNRVLAHGEDAIAGL